MRVLSVRPSTPLGALAVACAALGAPAPAPAQAPAPARASAPTADDVLDSMRERDGRGAETTTLVTSLTQVSSRRDPTQGEYTRSCVIVSGPEGVGMESASAFPGPPEYRRPDAPGYVADIDFDHEGNLIVWRTMRTAALSSSEFNQRYERLRKHRVHPSGVVIEEEDFHRLRQFPAGSWSAVSDAEAALWAAGRGLTRKIGRAHSATAQPDGTIELRASGAEDFSGFWVITVDPAHDWLVRRATFVAPDDLRPVVLVSTEGVVEGEGVRVAQTGSVRYRVTQGRDYEIKASVVRAERGDGRLETERIRQAARPSLPPGESEVIDYRTDPPTKMRPGHR